MSSFPPGLHCPPQGCYLVFGHIGRRGVRSLVSCLLHSEGRPEWERVEEPRTASWYPGKNCPQEPPGFLGRGSCVPRIPATARLGCRSPNHSFTGIIKGPLPKSEQNPFVPCRGRRKGDLGKSTRNPAQVRPPLRSGDCSPSLHFHEHPALAQREGQNTQPHTFRPWALWKQGPLLTSQIPM